MRADRAAAAALLLGGVVLGGCGASAQDRYCDVVADNQQRLGEIAAGGEPDAVLQALPIYRELADAAPSDVRGDWKVVIARISLLDQALRDADVDPDDYDPEQPPAGLDPADQTRIAQAASALVEESTLRGMAEVEQHSLDVCQTPLGL